MTFEEAKQLLAGDRDLSMAEGTAYAAFLERASLAERGFLLGAATEHQYRCKMRSSRELGAALAAEKTAQAARDESRVAAWKEASPLVKALHVLAKQVGRENKESRPLLALAHLLEHEDLDDRSLANIPVTFRPDLLDPHTRSRSQV